MSVQAGVSDVAISVREKLRGKIGQTKVKRYWPGKAPEWAEDVEEEADVRPSRVSAANREAQLEKAFLLRDELDFPRQDDPRLRRLAESRRDKDEAVARHRQIRQAEIVSTREEEKVAQELAEAEEDEDDEAIEERRQRIKAKLLQRQREEEAALEAELEEEDEEDEESEYETDSEEEFGGIAMIKPVFVPKSERDTIAEREKLEAEEEAMKDSLKKKLEERKIETKQLVVEAIKNEEEIEKNREAEGDGGEVDTDDETNEAEEYEAWKAREISRIKRDRDARDKLLKEREEVEKLRNMTEEERREWERKNPKPLPLNKKKWKFMQKYYHKGAFYQTEADDRDGAGGEEIFRRDFSAPTGEDKMDKTILPKVMQVKHFGRSGRTKWTHLVAEDTTDWNNPVIWCSWLRAGGCCWNQNGSNNLCLVYFFEEYFRIFRT
nr:microfibrillar-associated protein 1-like isoform X2 [Physcomitrium patens]|eukprot:XP_024377153.1 microfibrillar-associated protein 1-like isoform X2 [Physcomitrella patens]